MYKVSRKAKLFKILLVIMLLPIIVVAWGLLIPSQFNELKSMLFALSVILTIPDMLISYVVFLYICDANITFKEFIERVKIHMKLDEGFVHDKAYVESKFGDVLTPKIKFLDNKIIINFRNSPKIREAIEAHADSLSTALPDNYYVGPIKMYKDQGYLEMEIINLERDKQIKFDSPEQLDNAISNLDLEVVPIDANHSVNLKVSSSGILTGPTGSGKTYGAFYFIYIFLLKGYTLVCCDIKRTYISLKKLAICAFNVEDIIKTLQDTVNIMMQRSEEMQSILNNDPNAIASDYGYEPIVVVIEEFIALINMANVQQRKEINSLVSQLILMGRQLSVHTIILLQQAGAETLDTSIKSNCSLKMVYGNASESMYKTAFGLSDSTHINYQLKRGEGIAMIESDKFLYHTPEIKFSVSDLEKYLQK